MSNSVHIAVDAMGGDLGPRSTVAASLKFLSLYPNCQLSLVGQLSSFQSDLQAHPRLQLIDVPDVVTMADKPGFALRNKQSSSMAKAVAMVAAAEADACVSAGNTGALMAFALRQVGTLDGIVRPAICKAVPTEKGKCLVLDLGANLHCDAEQLQQFAVLGSVMARTMGIERPRIGVLNVGKEAQKGLEVHRQVKAFLETMPGVESLGFVEGNDIYSGRVDVVVCDGFSGNVVLKASEGAVHLLQNSLREVLHTNWLYRLLGYFLQPLFRRWQEKFDPAQYNGAALLGLRGIVIKSHGHAGEQGFLSALKVANEQASAGLLQQISAAMQSSAKAADAT